MLIAATAYCHGQSIVGRWQLVKQSNCVEEEMSEVDGNTQELLEDMKGLSSSTPQVIEFKENNSGQESTKIISQKKSYNSKAFLYRYDGSTLYFLDKRSRTIIEGFTVEQLESESLIISNTARVCETKVFVRLK